MDGVRRLEAANPTPARVYQHMSTHADHSLCVCASGIVRRPCPADPCTSFATRRHRPFAAPAPATMADEIENDEGFDTPVERTANALDNLNIQDERVIEVRRRRRDRGTAGTSADLCHCSLAHLTRAPHSPSSPARSASTRCRCRSRRTRSSGPSSSTSCSLVRRWLAPHARAAYKQRGGAQSNRPLASPISTAHCCLAVGASGLGKSTFANTLFSAHLVESKGSKGPGEETRKTTQIERVTHGTSGRPLCACGGWAPAPLTPRARAPYPPPWYRRRAHARSGGGGRRESQAVDRRHARLWRPDQQRQGVRQCRPSSRCRSGACTDAAAAIVLPRAASMHAAGSRSCGTSRSSTRRTTRRSRRSSASATSVTPASTSCSTSSRPAAAGAEALPVTG